MEHEERLKAALADRYQIEREIGSGGMATVYLAQDLKHDRQVAVKVLDPELARSLGPERFLREIKTAARLSHPHILPVYDSGEAEGFLFFVMPYVKGESLRARLTSETQLPIEDAVQITREIADALAHAHQEGVIHRDVKPANIMLEAGHAVLADFGVAHAVAEAKENRITRTGTSLGTPAYMSPEQAAGEEDLDGRSDQYALGCVLFEMLAGHPPFAGAKAESVLRQHLTEDPPSIIQARPTVTREVGEVINRALSKSPADRFRSAGEMAGALAFTTSPSGPQRGTFSKARKISLAFGLIGILVILVSIPSWFSHTSTSLPQASDPAARPTLAVLPFDDISPDPSHAYFSTGLHGELLTQLAQVPELSVVGRTSVVAYAETTKPLPQVAEELGVSRVLEGSVQVLGDRLRVNVLLLDAATGQQLWAEGYDRTLDDAFGVQSEIAQQVVTAVGLVLGDSIKRSIEARPTANPEAYRLYLQGQEYQRRPGRLRANLEIAADFYEQALALDPSFVLAHAKLSEVHGHFYWTGYDPSPARAALQREEAEAGLRLGPDLPQAHFAMGLAHYYGERDYHAALAEFQHAQRGAPNDPDLIARIGWVNRRLGNWEEVHSAFHRATELEPRSANLFYDLGGLSYMAERRYEEAIQAFDQAHALAPDFYPAPVRKGKALVRWKGELDTLRAVLAKLPLRTDLAFDGTVAAQKAQLLLWERNPEGLFSLLDQSELEVLETQNSFWPAPLLEAWAHEMTSDPMAAREAFGEALTFLDSTLVSLPEDVRIHGARGQALAGLGRQEEAFMEAEFLQQSDIYQRDLLDGPYVAEERALILAKAGAPSEALAQIEDLLSRPGAVTVHILRLDPRWDVIRDHPRFQALLEEYADDVEH
jgi:serine/threonine-protein kinase